MNEPSFVFDTNAFLSASLVAGSVNAIALERAFNIGKVVVSAATFAEFSEVLFRKKFDKYFTDDRRLQIIQKLERDIIVHNVNIVINACRDLKDNKFLELAVASEASCIITGDNDLLVLHPFNGIPIVSAANFLLLF
jgi:hypothetical protein